MRRSRLSPTAKIILLVTGLAALYGGWFAGHEYAKMRFQPQALLLYSSPQSLPALPLHDHLGNPVDLSQPAGWRLLLPLSSREASQRQLLQHLSRLHNRLAPSPELHREIRYLLIPADPQLSDREALGTLLHGYSHNFFALLGDEQTLTTLHHHPALQPRTASEEQPTIRFTDGGVLLLMRPNGQIIGEFPRLSDPQLIADDLQRLFALYR